MSKYVDNYKTWVEVSKDALENNIKIVRGLLRPGIKLLAVVKSNAYGHGLIETARFFSTRTDWLGVDNIDEAIALRDGGIKGPLLVMGYTLPGRFPEAVKNNLRLTLYNKISNLKIPNITAHIKIDTGMSRQGVTLADLPGFLKKMPSSISIEGVYTHFANADDLRDRTFPNAQLTSFKRALKIFESQDIKPTLIHASATTGLLTMPEAHFDMVRVGIALYGQWPSVEFAGKFNSPKNGLGLGPTLSWKTRLVQIKKIKKDSSVGYGITEKVKKDSTVAVLPVGYYDGYDRGLSSTGEVLVGRRRCKVLGRISMNLTVVDISAVKDAKVWDEVVLVGKQGREETSAEELAGKLGTISYEVTSRINPLLPRVYI